MSDEIDPLDEFLAEIDPPKPELEFDPAVVPEVEDVGSTDPDLDVFMNNIDIIDAYNRWCGKSTPNPGKKREGIKVSCPNPAHPDEDPSAWINLDEQVWYCGGCNAGGDKYDIAAWFFGFDVPGYKEKEDFPVLVARMAEDLGYTIKTTAAGNSYVEEMEIEEPDLPEEEAKVVSMFTGVEVEAVEVRLKIDWDKIVHPDTFLYEFMRAVTIDDTPHEYYFGMALQAVAAACGPDVFLDDFIPVKSNLNVTLLGDTSTNKSRAQQPLVRLLDMAMPFEPGDDFDGPVGVHIAATPTSSEAMVDIFQHKIMNPATMEVDRYAPVNAIIRIDELSEFITRAARSGSGFKEVSMALYDGYGDIKQKSLGGGLRVAHNPFCQMLTSTQPRAIQEFLSKTDEYNGFLNRWMIFHGAPRVRRISYGGTSPDIDRPADMLRSIHTWALTKHKYTLGGLALNHWDDFFNDVIIPLKEQSLPIMGRVDLTLKKLMIIFAANEKAANIDVSHVQQAIDLYSYITLTMNLFSMHIQATEYDYCWKELIRIFQLYVKKGKPPTRRNINQIIKDDFPANLVTQVLLDMIRADMVEEKVTRAGSRGPASTRYEYVGA